MLPALKKRQLGFTLMEVLVFTAIFSSTFVVVLGTISYASIVLKNAQYRTFATHYSQELLEWVKYQKEELGYDEIKNKIGTYCFNITPIAVWPGSTGICATYGLESFYKRELTLAGDASQLTATTTTSWQLLGADRSVVLEVRMSNL